MAALAQTLSSMSLDEFLDWNPDDARRWQLMDGEPLMMAPPTVAHGMLQAEFGRVVGNHLRDRSSRCRLAMTPGIVPSADYQDNFRIPDVAVSCAPQPAGARALVDPLLIVEILSPSNAAQTWSNVWSYTGIKSLREVVVLRTDMIGAYVLRGEGGEGWPSDPGTLEERTLVLDSIGLRTDLVELYRGTPLDPKGG